MFIQCCLIRNITLTTGIDYDKIRIDISSLALRIYPTNDPDINPLVNTLNVRGTFNILGHYRPNFQGPQARS